MPRRRTAGRLLSRRHLTPAIRLASNSGSTDACILSAGEGSGVQGLGRGALCHLLTVPAVLELLIPQVCQADEGSLTDVALLWQGCVADRAAAAPHLQELLQRLADSTTPASSDSPTCFPSIPGKNVIPLRPTRKWSWDIVGTEDQTGLTCMSSGRLWLSTARYPSRLCSTGVCNRGWVSCHCLPGRHHPPATCLAGGAQGTEVRLPRSPRAGMGLG